MGQHILTIVVTADEPDFSTALDDAVAALQADGFTPTEVRVTSDQGEQVIPVPPPEEPEPEPSPEPPNGSPGPGDPPVDETQLPDETPGASGA